MHLCAAPAPTLCSSRALPWDPLCALSPQPRVAGSSPLHSISAWRTAGVMNTAQCIWLFFDLLMLNPGTTLQTPGSDLWIPLSRLPPWLLAMCPASSRFLCSGFSLASDLLSEHFLLPGLFVVPGDDRCRNLGSTPFALTATCHGSRGKGPERNNQNPAGLQESLGAPVSPSR